MYEIVFSRKASRFVKTLHKSYKEKIKDILENLKEDPFSYPYKKIKGKTNMYRIRVGKYRVLYKVDEKKRITVLKIDKRSRVHVGNWLTVVSLFYLRFLVNRMKYFICSFHLYKIFACANI